MEFCEIDAEGEICLCSDLEVKDGQRTSPGLVLFIEWGIEEVQAALFVEIVPPVVMESSA